MPMLDVSFMLVDPMLSDCFDVTRRSQSVGENGRVIVAPAQVFRRQRGVITQQSPSDLMKTEDGQSLPRRIFIASRFQFIAIAPGVQPDEITWNGTVYTAEESLPYSRFGTGFYECVALYRGPVPPLQ